MLNISYKKKVLYLLAGLLIFMIIGYQFSIKRTLQLRQEYKEYRKQINSISNAPQKIGKLRQRINNIESTINTSSVKGKNYQENILEACGSFCRRYELTLKEFPKTHIYTQDDYHIETNIVRIQGTFKGIVRLIYYLECEKQVGNLVSVRFKTHKDRRTERTYLISELFLQNIIKITDETN